MAFPGISQVRWYFLDPHNWSVYSDRRPNTSGADWPLKTLFENMERGRWKTGWDEWKRRERAFRCARNAEWTLLWAIWSINKLYSDKIFFAMLTSFPLPLSVPLTFIRERFPGEMHLLMVLWMFSLVYSSWQIQTWCVSARMRSRHYVMLTVVLLLYR